MGHARQIILAGALLLSVGAGPADAAVLSVSLPEFSGNPHGPDETFPLASLTVGTFLYDLPPGEAAFSAALAGAFGNAQGGNTAPVDLFFQDLLVAQCTGGGSCDTLPQEQISFNFSKIQLQYVEQKQPALRAVQTGPGIFRLGPATLTIETRPIPEPATGWLLGTGLGGAGPDAPAAPAAHDANEISGGNGAEAVAW